VEREHVAAGVQPHEHGDPAVQRVVPGTPGPAGVAVPQAVHGAPEVHRRRLLAQPGHPLPGPQQVARRPGGRPAEGRQLVAHQRAPGERVAEVAVGGHLHPQRRGGGGGRRVHDPGSRPVSAPVPVPALVPGHLDRAERPPTAAGPPLAAGLGQRPGHRQLAAGLGQRPGHRQLAGAPRHPHQVVGEEPHLQLGLGEAAPQPVGPGLGREQAPRRAGDRRGHLGPPVAAGPGGGAERVGHDGRGGGRPEVRDLARGEHRHRRHAAHRAAGSGHGGQRRSTTPRT
jgi:hypothetical protein